MESTRHDDRPCLCFLLRCWSIALRPRVAAVCRPRKENRHAVCGTPGGSRFDSGGRYGRGRAVCDLRRNPLWRRWPKKAFGVYEGDNPPRFCMACSGARNAGREPGGISLVRIRCTRSAFLRPSRLWPRSGTVQKTCFSRFPAALATGFARGCFAFLFRRTPSSFKIRRTTTISRQKGKIGRLPRDGTGSLPLDRSSFFVRGAGTSSIRLFEMLEAGIAPVIISDDWIPPHGPRWDEFALRMPERDVGRVYEIVKSHEGEFGERGARRPDELTKVFAPTGIGNSCWLRSSIFGTRSKYPR